MKINLLFTILVFGFNCSFGQNVGINSTGANPDNSSMLDVSSTDKGMLIPRMTAAQRIAIATPATGLLVYQTDLEDGFWYFDGAIWISLSGDDDWNVVGTSQHSAVSGNVGIGTAFPTQKLDVAGNTRLRNRLYDGNNTSGTAGQVLSSTGTGTDWVNIAGVTPAVIGTLTSTVTPIAVDGAAVYTGSYIDLPPGKWIVQVSMLLRKAAAPFVLADDEGYWVRTTFSNSPTTYSLSADFEGAHLFSGSLVGPSEFGLINGTCIINNTGTTTKRYYYWKVVSEVYGTNGVAAQPLSNFGTALYNENQIVAIPVN